MGNLGMRTLGQPDKLPLELQGHLASSLPHFFPPSPFFPPSLPAPEARPPFQSLLAPFPLFITGASSKFLTPLSPVRHLLLEDLDHQALKRVFQWK
jgi:hypothetical protein